MSRDRRLSIMIFFTQNDNLFARRLEVDLISRFGTYAVRAAMYADTGNLFIPEVSLDQLDSTCCFVIVISPEALANPGFTSALSSLSAPRPEGLGIGLFISAMVRPCEIPVELLGNGVVSFAEGRNHHAAFADLVDTIQYAMDPDNAYSAISHNELDVAKSSLGATTHIERLPMFVPRIFISHSSADNAFGLYLEQKLKSALGDPDSVFYDRDGSPSGLIGGDEWMGRLQFEIAARNVFVLLLSPEAIDSMWVQKELRQALREAVSGDNKVIIPVMHRETSIWPFLKDYQVVSFVSPRSPDDAFTELLDAVRLGHSRQDELKRIDLGRRGPPFDVDLLPLPDRFVGRGADVDWALQRLDPTTPHPARRANVAFIAAANGLGGIGKSALAGHVARILYAANSFPDGIAVVLCHGLTEPETILRLVLARFDRNGQEPQEQPLQSLRDLAKRTFAGRHALVVLDNVEPNWPVEQVIRSLRTAGVSLLVTSRHRLPSNVVSASLSRVLQVLSPAEAQDLFIENYGSRSRPEFMPTELAHIAAIVNALGHHTLAIKLAAARAQGRDLESLARSYDADKRLGLHLKDGTEAVQIVLTSSVDSLPESARTLFASLGAFATGDLGRNAAIAVAVDLKDPDPDISLQALIDLRLVDAYVAEELPDKADRERLRLHPLVRAYSRELADAANPSQMQALQSAIGSWFENYTRDALNQSLAMDEANIEGYLEWAEKRQINELLVSRTTALICDHMKSYWRDTGRTRAGLAHLPSGMAAAERVANIIGERADKLLAIDIAAYYGDILLTVGKELEARKIFAKDLSRRRELGDRRGEGITLGRLGTVARLNGWLDEAQMRFKQSLAIAEEQADLQEKGTMLANIGAVARQRGKLDEAQQYYETALAIAREIGDLVGQSADLNNLGSVARQRGKLDEAQQYYERSLAIANVLRDRGGEGVTLANLGCVAQQRARFAKAQQYYERSLAIAREIGDLVGQSVDLNNLGSVARQRGKLDEAQQYYETALAIAREIGHHESIGAAMANLGYLAEQRGRLDEAQKHYEGALAAITRVGDRRCESILLTALGRLARSGERFEAAEVFFERAFKMDEAISDRDSMAIDWSDLVEVLEATGQDVERKKLDLAYFPEFTG